MDVVEYTATRLSVDQKETVLGFLLESSLISITKSSNFEDRKMSIIIFLHVV